MIIIDLNKISRWWNKIRLRPIRIYCLHHVCTDYDAESMNACDWMEIGVFRQKVHDLQAEEVEFISLSEAYRHICEDLVRCKKYAVLTFDDGYSSLNEVLPWLDEQHIPATLFMNGKYLDGKSYRKSPKEKYLTKNELFALTSPLIEIGNHGWEHLRVTEQTEEEFEKSVLNNYNLLREHPNYVPFWAYTYGVHTKSADIYLHSKDIVPVYIDGMKNYNDANVIHRELLQ